MATYNIQKISGSASFTMTDGSILNIAEISIEVDGKEVIKTTSVSIRIENGVLKILTKGGE